jgi:hypothetical protein
MTSNQSSLLRVEEIESFEKKNLFKAEIFRNGEVSVCSFL